MIFDFALEPELVATWHDRSVAYPFLCQLGRGHRKVPCTFPAARWKSLVIEAFQASSPPQNSPAGQAARKAIEVLLRHLDEVSTRRNGRIADAESWLTAACNEHGEFPFGGILVRNSGETHAALVCADRIGEVEFPAWNPAAPPVLRTAIGLATALAPLLRSASQLRFVDPYFDAEDASFFEPMREYLARAQARRTVGDLRLQLHLAVRNSELEKARRDGRNITESGLANEKLDACATHLLPLLQQGVSLHGFVWGRSQAGVEMHNRYVLSEVGGLAVQTGLDREIRNVPRTDDITVLSREQHAARWLEYSPTGTLHRLVAERDLRA
ncbi:MAG: hypothetical protein HYS27_04960 [Deltaproteobacteria bacterium]|nr:hypothetical protein [Deltaproteobacteria bacterium]